MVERQRRSFAQYHGAIATRGEPALAATLAAAWRAAQGDGRELTHGFHPYPARLHPLLARRLVAALSRPGETVLDPFCGSGTVLVEARAAGRRALGSDVNALALLLARQKCAASSPALRARLRTAGERLARRAYDERIGRDEAQALDAIPADLARWFEPHVLHELDTLGRGLDHERDPACRAALLLCLSSLLTKVSRRRAETDAAPTDKRIAPGFTARAFAERAAELSDALAALEAAARRAPAAALALADARALPWRSGVATLALGSPPYLGTYDYDAIVDLRARLLSIPLAAAQRHEFGRRSQANAAPAAAARDYVAALRAIGGELARVVAPGGLVVLVVGDSEAGGRSFAAPELLDAAFAGLPLEFAAAAAQARPGPRTPRAGRAEHLLAWRRHNPRPPCRT